MTFSGSNLVLRSWGESNREAETNANPGYVLLRYSILVLWACVASLLAGVLLWVYCVIRSARWLHDTVGNHLLTTPPSLTFTQMLNAVLRAPLGWFERTPQGR